MRQHLQIHGLGAFRMFPLGVDAVQGQRTSNNSQGAARAGSRPGVPPPQRIKDSLRSARLVAKPQALGGALHVQVQNSSVVLNGGSEHRTCMSHLSRGRGEAFDGCRVGAA